jgi:hypothetical protein
VDQVNHKLYESYNTQIDTSSQTIQVRGGEGEGEGEGGEMKEEEGWGKGGEREQF